MANENKIKTRVQMKADTAENWSKAEGFTPLLREPIFYTDTGEIRLGDGETNVNDLPQFNVGKKTSGGEIFNDYENNIAEAYAFRLIDATRAADGTGTFKIARTPSSEKAWTKLLFSPGSGIGLEYSAHIAALTSPGTSDAYTSQLCTYKAHDAWEEDGEGSGQDGPLTLYVNSSYISDEPLMTFIYKVGTVPETIEQTFPFNYNGMNCNLKIRATETNYLEFATHDRMGGIDSTPTIQLDYEVLLYSTEGELDSLAFTEPLVYITFSGSQFDCYGEGVGRVYINETTADGQVDPIIQKMQVENFGKITQLNAYDDYYLITVDKGITDPHNYFTGHNFYAYDSYENFSDVNIIRFISQPLIGDVIISYMAHAEGGNNQAIGKYSHTEGSSNISYGSYAHTQGLGNKAGYAANASGYGNIASGQVSSANGYETKALNYRAFTQGFRTSATGRQALATGENTVAAGGNSLSAGLDSQAIGQRSIAGGSGSIAKADDSQAIGIQAQTDNLEAYLKYPGGAVAFGYMTKAFGSYGAVAEGRETEALGQTSHAQGFRTIAKGRWQDVMGTLNLVDNRYGVSGTGGYIQIIGNGYQKQGLEGRSNAYALDWDGNGFYAGDLYVNTVFSDNGDDTFSVSGSKVATQNEVAVSVKNINNTINSLITRDGETGTIRLVGNGSYAYSLQYAQNSTVSQMGGVVFGYGTKATNYWATAFGSYSEANGNASFAAGNKCVTSVSVKGQAVFGNHNAQDDAAQFIVGCSSYGNGLTVTIDGRLKTSSFVGKQGQFVTIGENGELVATEILVGGTY